MESKVISVRDSERVRVSVAVVVLNKKILRATQQHVEKKKQEHKAGGCYVRDDTP